MADTTILKEFLYRLGYTIDETSERKFREVVATATKRIVEFAAAAEGAAATVRVAVTAMASKLDDLYFASRRIGTSAQDIQAFTYSVSQMGGTAEGARSSLENLGRFLRTMPGAEGFLRGLGVSQGAMRDTSLIMGELAQRFRGMSYPRANAYASVLGIDERTLMAMRDGVGEFGDQYRGWVRAAGLDTAKATEDAHGFMVALRSIGTVLDILWQKTTAELAKGIGGDVTRLRGLIVANFGTISRWITQAAKVVIQVGDAFTHLAVRAVEGARQLIPWWEKVTGLTVHLRAAFAILALEIMGLLNPIALAGLALLGLWDDYKVWKEGGKSLIDWREWEPDIKAALDAVHELGGAFKALGEALSDLNKRFTGGDLFGKNQLISDLHQITAAVTNFATYLAGYMRLLAAAAHGDVPGALSALKEMSGAMGLEPHADALTGRESEKEMEQHYSRFGYGAGWRMWGRVKGWLGLGGSEEPAKPLPPGEAQQNGRRLYQEFLRLGYTPEGAASMTGSARGESGFDPNRRGDGGHAGGYFQWHKGRRDAILKATGIDVWDTNTTPEQAAQAADAEMRFGLDPSSSHYQRIRNAMDVGQGTRDVVTAFERSADQEGDIAKRTPFAREALGWGAGMALPSAAIAGIMQMRLGGAGLTPDALERPALVPDAPGRFGPVANDRGGAGVVINQQTSINVEGAGDASTVAARVAGLQGRVNGDMQRNFQGAAR